ncbi:YsnF/AvaK domain-containing protein [Massilia sp. 9096]|uniref:YsnF/AvaK domain-containing protein n=1 Tax=Massilia sp. 9096 TaxID=1500894 RepID=UPI00069042DA|nr:YsnF/AvaK domain-containing protein [Massilia sp. 9096]
MSRTITALFDTRADAEAGRQRLLDANLHADHVRIHDKSSVGEAGYSSHQEPGLWASIKNAFLPDEDRHTYEEGVRRGGFLLTADVDEHQADEAVRALDEAHVNTVDIDERATQWRSEGWVPPATATTAATALGAARAGGAIADDSLADAAAATTPATATTAAAAATGDEARFKVVEEQLIVGKREVDRGGVRVRSYVTETPVHEQISLRDEKVRVARHAVDRPAGEDAFREQSIELTATGEEAVVSKTARVVEEVVVNKTAEQRVEGISDTVRRTDVVVEQLDASGQPLKADQPGFDKR